MKKISIGFLLLLVTGCATTSYVVSGGDRAAGTVRLVCNYDILTACGTDVTPEMRKSAIDTCIRWGYDGATPFGGYVKNPADEYTGHITIDFQCVGDLEI